MGDGNARIGGCSNAGGHTRHHLHRNAAICQVGSLLPTSTEQERVPSLQSDHNSVPLGHVHQHRIGAGLRNRVMTPSFADEMTLAARGHEIQHLLGHQRVIDERITFAEKALSLDGEQLRISGASSDQINGSGLFSGRHGRAANSSIRA